MILESQCLRYALTLAAMAAGLSRLDWLFGGEVRLAFWKASVGLCDLTGHTVCF